MWPNVGVTNETRLNRVFVLFFVDGLTKKKLVKVEILVQCCVLVVSESAAVKIIFLELAAAQKGGLCFWPSYPYSLVISNH